MTAAFVSQDELAHEAVVAQGTVESASHFIDSGWQRRYARRLSVTDALAVVLSVVVAQLLRFETINSSTDAGGFGSIPYWGVSSFLILGWLATLSVSGSRDFRLLGTGVLEYRRLIEATFGWFGAVAIASVALKIDLARGFLLIALPLGLAALMLERKAWRTWLVSCRARTGALSNAVVVAGSGARASVMIREILRSPASGYRLVGVALPEGDCLSEDVAECGLPIGRLDDAVTFMRNIGGDTIAVSGGDSLQSAQIKRMSWELEAGREHMVLSAGLLDIAGPRMSMRPVAGLSLIHVETPRLAGWRSLTKNLADYLGAGALVVLLSPVLLVVALLVKTTSPGPVLFRQQRIGQHGEPFRMLKFRSMRANADLELQALLEKQGTADKPLFKVQDDPRITQIGRFLRRFSVDELPQLFNVLRGEMSLIGPRPQVPAEVALYDHSATRRLLVKPGLTGLWQVSGRSNLSWEETIRLDLYYVENWSMTEDLYILLRTVRAVVGRDGAY